MQIETIRQQLTHIKLPQNDLTIAAAKQLIGIRSEGNEIILDFQLGYPIVGLIPEIQQFLTAQLPDISQLKINITSQIKPHRVQSGLKPIPNVKNTIAVASGKGGVGKSTTAVNLALALHQMGARVGLLDADIYGPNQPQMLGIEGHPEQLADQRLLPLNNHGIQSMSIGYLIETRDTPMIWRGPMVSNALQQLAEQTVWDNLDYLIIDLPPGTGDIQLTLAQKIPVSAGLIITTPQEVALLDARKAYRMFEKVNIPLLGVIENMSVYHCPHCGHTETIFGHDGAKQMAKEYNVELLGQIPLHSKIREQADSGKPTVVSEPNSDISKIYITIAKRIAIKISELVLDTTHKFPKIVIEK